MFLTLLLCDVGVGSETLTTVWAYKGPLIGVDHHVNFQILPFRKGLTTVFGSALKRLSSKM
jgi:hypothetical protein